MSDLPALEGEPASMLSPRHIWRISGSLSSLDLDRGCPYQCSFCTIINVQGRKSRFRTPDDLERAIRENYAQGIRRFFITDDNFARNRHWEALFYRMIRLRLGDGLKIGFTIQVDTLCHRIPNFIEKAAQAGVRRVFIGLENINPDNLIEQKAPEQDHRIPGHAARVARARRHHLRRLHHRTSRRHQGIDPARHRHHKREMPLDVLELFYLTPLPGSEDHKALWQNGLWMDDDLNKYDLYHRVAHHPRMADADWDEAYRAAWESFYSFDHMRTILRRAAAAPNGRPQTTLTTLLWFKLMTMFEAVHPLEGGAFRRKSRRERRYGLAPENPVVFYPRCLFEIVVKAWGYWSVYRRSRTMLKAVLAAPDRWTYTDLSIAPPHTDEFDNLDLYHATSGGEAALARMRRDDALREKAH